MFTPFLGQPSLLKVTQARADQIQTWVNREHVEIDQPNPGRGKARLYSELDAMKIGVMVRLAAFGISVVKAAEFAAYVDRRYRENKPIRWDEFTVISFISQMRKAGTVFVSQNAPSMKLGISQGDTEHMHISTHTEWVRGAAPHRRDASGAIIPEKRDELASRGIHAEPFLFFPIGEVVNGIRCQVSDFRVAESAE